MPYKGKAATHSGQGKDTIQPKNDTYMCHALAGRDRPENSAPALTGGGGTMREFPHPPNEASPHMNPLSNLTYEHMENLWPSDPVRAREASNPVYGHDLKGEGTDPDTDLRPASMEPYAVRYQEEGADADKDHRPASMDPYAVRYQDEGAADDNSLSHEMEAAGTSGNNAGTSENDVGTSRNDASTSGNDTVTSRNDTDTSIPRRNDRNMSGTRKPRNAQSAAGGTTPKQQTDWQARADATASIPNPMYASRADRMYPAGVSGRCALCSFIRSQLIYMVAGIAVLLSLVAMGLALLAFINNEEMYELTTTVDTLKRDQDDMRQLPTTVHALKLDLDKERSRTGPASEQHLDKTSKTTGLLSQTVSTETQITQDESDRADRLLYGLANESVHYRIQALTEHNDDANDTSVEEERGVTFTCIQRGTKKGRGKLTDSLGYAYTVKRRDLKEGLGTASNSHSGRTGLEEDKCQEEDDDDEDDGDVNEGDGIATEWEALKAQASTPALITLAQRKRPWCILTSGSETVRYAKNGQQDCTREDFLAMDTQQPDVDVTFNEDPHVTYDNPATIYTFIPESSQRGNNKLISSNGYTFKRKTQTIVYWSPAGLLREDRYKRVHAEAGGSAFLAVRTHQRALGEGRDLSGMKTDMSLSKLKPVHADLLLGAIGSIADNRDAITRTLERTGIWAAVD
uniref:Uncharacterized protein n=1 Tax=Branchiostoma floridae TaxID=7739 RepID=C3YG62_BRAFL|eukprot:XP_002604857.1 hypothetical protein BRAFLDRAFT_70709 [Branchiostoma floridae]